MRAAILTPQALSRRAGGVEIFTEQLSAALGGAQVFSPPPSHAGASAALAHGGLAQPAEVLAAARAFRKAQAADPYDLVISNGLSGWPLTFAPPASPMIQVYHLTLAGFSRKALRRRNDRFTTGRVGGFFDRLAGTGKTTVAVSEPVRREVEQLYGHAATVLPNGVDVSLFRRGNRAAAREHLGLPAEARIGLFVGRAEYAKGFDLVQEAAQRLKDIILVAVSPPVPGANPVRFLGSVPHERMPLIYTAADFFLLPSRYEGLSLSLLEAWACELPVVTSAAAYPLAEGAPHLATVVDPLTPEGLERAVREAAETGPRRDVRERVIREYSQEAFRGRWGELARQVIRSGL